MNSNESIYKQRAFACFNKNEYIRKQSTSGGIFTLVAHYVLNKQGVVFGAVFDEHFNVIHTGTDNLEGLKAMRGSKYPQSNVSHCYVDIAQYLKDNRLVLFTGTPCQIVALKSFLKKDYEKLILMDFVCHGVASPQLWSDYLGSFNCKKIKEIIFKDKTKGWKRWYVKIKYDNEELYQRGRMNSFMRSYLQYANIRPCCYECKFKGLNRKSDLTISDCWGLGEQNKQLNDDGGLSALLINTKKGEHIFNQISDKMKYLEYNPQKLMEGNWTCFKSVQKHAKRDEFFRVWRNAGAIYALNKYFAPKLDDWIYYYYLRLIGKEK